MKTLILMRHAKSTWEHPYLEDKLRPLNDRGKRDAPLMGQYLVNAAMIPDVVLSSSAVRTVATTNLLCQAMNVPKSNINLIDDFYTFSDNGDLYMSHLTNLDDTIDTALIVGHNDTCYNLAHRLIPDFESKFPTCACLCVIWQVDTWKEVHVSNSILECYITPKELKPE